jgi:acetylornithine deacetylase/succinyl-diaminopimelate desuccinylase-like protein
MAMQREAIFRHIEENQADHIAHIQRWVRQPSVSWDDIGVSECADLVAESFRALGCQEVEVIPGRYHPGVWAYYDAGAPVTVHSYCMFDTRTVDPKRWTGDPWSGDLGPLGPYPKVLKGRGAVGAKGPFVAFLNALSSIIAVEGTLPVNIMFLAEGEEIMGSPTYREFVERYRHRLAGVQASYCAASSQSPNGSVNVGLGLKGMVVLELTVAGSRWPGAPAHTIHSSAAGLVHSPPLRLAQALATLTEPDGSGFAVDGLQDLWTFRKPLADEELQLLQALAAKSSGRDWRDVLPVGGAKNVSALVGGSEGMDPLINFLYGPTFNVPGLYAGFLGRRSGTIPFITPGSASAMVDLRWVVDAPPEELIDALRKHLDRRGFDDVEITVFSAFSHAQTPVSHPMVKAALDNLSAWGLEADVWPIQAGGGPWTVVPNAFDVPCLRGAIPGYGSGGDDEYLVIEGNDKVAGLVEVEKAHVDLLVRVAAALAPLG